MSYFKSQVQKVKNLPSLPVVAREILSITNDSTLSMEKLMSIVGKDPVIIAKVLSVANSAFFRISERTTTLQDAMMRIGLNNVKNIAIGISLLTLLSDGKKTSGFPRLFNHSLFVGLAARSTAKQLKLSFAEEILTEGLLHDLGFLVLNKYFSESFQEIVDNLEGKSILEAEKEIIDHSHAEVGFWLAEKWNLPDTILNAILFHHTPGKAPSNEKHASLIHVVDYVTSNNMYRPTEKDPGYKLDRSALEILSITDNDLTDIDHTVTSTLNTSDTSGRLTGY